MNSAITFKSDAELDQPAKARLAAIVESSDDAIIGKTLDGIITDWNRGAQRIFGYTPEEAIGQPVSMLIPPERRAEEQEILRALRRASGSSISKPYAAPKTGISSKSPCRFPRFETKRGKS